MKAITVQFKNGKTGMFRTTNSGSNITLGMINSDFFRKNFIKECANISNWTDGTLNAQNAFNYFGANILNEIKIDGRRKEAKKMTWFTVQYLVNNK